MLTSLTNYFPMAQAETSTPIKNCTTLNSLDQSPILNRTVTQFKPIDSTTVMPTHSINHFESNPSTENGHPLSDHEMSQTNYDTPTDRDSNSSTSMSNHVVDLVREPKSPTRSRKRKLVTPEIASKNHTLKQCLLDTLADVIPYHQNLSLRLLMTYTIDNSQSECILIDEILNKNQADQLDLIRLNPTRESKSGSAPIPASSCPTSILNSVLLKKEEQLLQSGQPDQLLIHHLNKPIDTHALDLSVRPDSTESSKSEDLEPNSLSTNKVSRPNPGLNEEKIGKLCTMYDSLSVQSSKSSSSSFLGLGSIADGSSISATYSVPISLLSASTTAPIPGGNAIITTTTVSNTNQDANVTVTEKQPSSASTNSEGGPDSANLPGQANTNSNSNGGALKTEYPLIDASSILTLLPFLQQHQNQTVLNLLNPANCFPPSSSSLTSHNGSNTISNNQGMINSTPNFPNLSSSNTLSSQSATISNAASLLLNQLCGSTSIETTPPSSHHSLIKPLEQHHILNNTSTATNTTHSSSSSGSNISTSVIQPSGLNNPSIIGFPLFNPFLTSDQLNAVQTLLPSGGPLLGATLAAPNFTSLNLGSATLFNLKDKNTGLETVSIMPSINKAFNQNPMASQLINPLSVRTFTQLINQTNASLGSVHLNPSNATISLAPNSTILTNPIPIPGEEPVLNGQSTNLGPIDKDPVSLTNPWTITSNSARALSSIITSLSTSSLPSSLAVSSSTTIANSLNAIDNSKLNAAMINNNNNNSSHTTDANSHNSSSTTTITNNNNNNNNNSNNHNHFLFGRRLTHSRRFTCNQCRRNFASLADLNRHTLETHNSFRCTICSAHFTQRSNLQRHSLKHVGFKPFTCNLCKKEYYRKDHLVRHIEVTHPNHDPKMNITVHLTSSECLDYLDRLNSGKTSPSPPGPGNDLDRNEESVDEESAMLQVDGVSSNNNNDGIGEDDDDDDGVNPLEPTSADQITQDQD